MEGHTKEAAIDLEAEPDFTLALVKKLQQEEDSCSARKLQRTGGQQRVAEAPSIPDATAPLIPRVAAAPPIPLASVAAGLARLPPSIFSASSDHQTMRSIFGMLNHFHPQVVSDPVSMASQNENWTCGYENLAALLRSIAGRGILGSPPDLSPHALQRHVESAWQAGFDPQSALELRPLSGTRKWLGAPEMCAMLWHLQFDSWIFEISGVPRLAKNVRGSGPALCAAVRVCLDRCTDLPLILQHAGHSRTVIGATSSPCGLILRDPAYPSTQYCWASEDDLDGTQYQLVLVRNRTAARDATSQRVSSEAARARAGEPENAAIWYTRGWQYSHWCELRF